MKNKTTIQYVSLSDLPSSRLVQKVYFLPLTFSPSSCIDAGVAILKKIDQNVINGNDVAGSVMAISQVSEEIMGGTSGALYSYAL